MTPIHIIATIFLIVAGQPYGEPARVPNKLHFSSIAACDAYMQTPEFSRSKAALADFARSIATERLRADDGSVPNFDLAITASCEEDDTI